MLYHFSKKKIVIYGTGGLSQKVEKTLKLNDLVVEAYIDRRADDIKYFLEKKVYSLSQIEKFSNKSEYLIIITTKNVFEHNRIAAELFDKGFENIIYKNYQILQGEKESDALDEAFEYLLNQNKIPERAIESIDVTSLFYLKDSAYIKENNQDVYLYLPAFMLFTNKLQDWLWSRVHFETTFLTVDMYRSFQESHNPEFIKMCKRYIKYFAKEGAFYLGLNTEGEWEEFVIDGRMAVYKEMDRMLCFNPHFFIENCPRVDGDPSKGYELISTGKNRVAFLIAKGYEFIPVRMSKECYQKFLNISSYNKLKKYMEDNSIVNFKTTVYHPYLYKFSVKYDRYYELWLRRVVKIIVEEIFSKTNKFDFSKIVVKIACCDDGATERYLKMLGFQVFNMYPKLELENILNEMLQIQNEKKSVNAQSDYTIIFDENICDYDCIKKEEKILFIAGRDLDIQNFLENNREVIKESEEIFSTIWDKKIYSGYKVRKL